MVISHEKECRKGGEERWRGNGTAIEIWRFDFTNVLLWEVPTEVLRNIGSVGVLPLLALTCEGAQPEVVDEALAGIEQSSIDREAERNLLTIALTLARLALSGPDHLNWLRGRFYRKPSGKAPVMACRG